MASGNNWVEVSESNFEWEREALEFVRAQFPSHEPYRAWSNFEFIAKDGSVNEVDLLVFSKMGIFLIEIKSRPGTISGDARTWTWEHEGRRYTDDNPVLLADRKCKKLKSLLSDQKAATKFKGKLPRIEPMVFCSDEHQQLHLPEHVQLNVVLRDRKAEGKKKSRPGVMAAILRLEGVGIRKTGNPDKPLAKAFSQAIKQSGIRPSKKSRTVTDFEIEDLIMEGPHFQDWSAQHVKTKEVKRRIRIYQVRLGASEEQRSAIERAALREFQLLETLQHPGILRSHGFTEHELGSAVLFEHFPPEECLRLDHYLAERGHNLSQSQRVDLVRQIADVVRFAHTKRVVHRSLSPQSILVVDTDSDSPQVKVFNWQSGYRTSSDENSSGAISATRHVGSLVDDLATGYMAPETLLEEAGTGEHLDVFSLGAITYHIFAGKPPAGNGLELAEKIAGTEGLQISSGMNGAGDWMQMLVQEATHPDVAERTDNIGDFLTALDEVAGEVIRAEENIVEDPLKAKAGQRLPEGMAVLKELGTGASSKALLVSLDDKEAVLKVAATYEHNDRLRGEGEVLQKLHHQHIVKHFKTLEIGGRVCLLMSRAGTETLGDRLAKAGRLHVGLLSRFGEDLLDVVKYIEEQGINHRDIKPHNIGVGKVGSGDKLHLTLFDFSLSRTATDNIHAGTVGYLDPFLSQRKTKQWDLHAERYAAAVTLFELATGGMPKWGQGNNPAVVDQEATITPESFSASARERLAKFFQKALRRDPAERFDNAEDMLREWRRCFDTVEDKPATHHDEDELKLLLDAAGFETSITQIGLSDTALEALDNKNILTVRDLLLRKPGRLKRMSGIVGDVRREIIHVANILRDRLGTPSEGELTQLIGPETALDDVATASATVDVIAQRILAGAKKDEEVQVVRAFLGLATGDANAEPPQRFPGQSEVADFLAIDRKKVQKVLKAARQRWKRDAVITRLRSDISEIIEREGGVMSVAEVATAVVLTRGSVEEEPLQTMQALAVVRAAVEAEGTLTNPEIVVRRDDGRIVVASQQALADYAMSLGRIADELAGEDPLVPAARALDQLRAVPAPAESPTLPNSRLIRIATGASATAAVSSLQQIYPKGMEAGRALLLSQGALLGVKRMTVQELKARVSGRFPESEPLPDRPQLDKLLQKVGLGFVWDQTIRPSGAFRLPSRDNLVTSDATSQLRRSRTNLTELPREEVSPDDAAAWQFEERLLRACDSGSFIAMTVEPRAYMLAMEQLTSSRFGAQPFDLESAFIRELKQICEERAVKWDRVLQADAQPDSEDWRRLMKLVRAAMPKVEEAILNADGIVLLAYSGLLVRYEQMDVLTRIRDQVGGTSGIKGLWMLIASDEQTSMPVMDNKPIPVIGPAEWARISNYWAENKHRSTQRSAFSGQKHKLQAESSAPAGGVQ